MSEPSHQDELLAELAQLQADNRARKLRLARMLRWGSLLVGASFVFFLRGDIRYALQPRAPLDLGGPLEFNLDREATERFARVTGVPAQRSANVSHANRNLRVFGLLGTNLLVIQDLDHTTPDQAPTSGSAFTVQGRLQRDDDATELANIFPIMEAAGFIAQQDGHFFALYADELPKQGWGLPLELLGIVVFVLVNFRAAHVQARQARAVEAATDSE